MAGRRKPSAKPAAAPPPATVLSAEDQSWVSRWRLVLGKTAEQSGISCAGDPQASAAQAAIDFVFEGDDRGAGSGDSVLTVPTWIDAVSELFPRQAKEVLERELISRRGIAELLDHPKLLEKVEPNVELVKTLLTHKDLLDPRARDPRAQDHRPGRRTTEAAARGAHRGRDHRRAAQGPPLPAQGVP